MKITLHDGRIANFPDKTPPHVVGKTIGRMISQDGGKADMDAEEKKKQDEQKKKDQTDELRHKEKIAVGLQGVKASQEGNKSAGEHIKATKELGSNLGKAMGTNAAQLATELAGIRKSLDGFKDVGKQLRELTVSIDELGAKLESGIKMAVTAIGKPKKIMRSERGALVGIKQEDD